jgi:pyruvate/2-oxoglutarate dehydrogenase complex dihydrolipoamide dehydrogenase (E3) component
VSGREFDVLVIGAGPAGEVVAGRLAKHGLSVALVERELVGGECSFYACMPSKALLRPAQALAETRRVPGAAQAAMGDLDVEAALRRRDEIVHDLDDGAQLPWLEERGVTLVRGHGELVGERTVRVRNARSQEQEAGEDQGEGTEAQAPVDAGHGVAAEEAAGDGEDLLLHARRAVVLATGSGAALPPIPGLREARPWTNREVTTAKAIPSSLLVLGGGVVGVEMAQAYASLGAQVTLVEAQQRLISGEEEFASEQVREGLLVLGVTVKLGVKATAVKREGADGPVTLELEDGAKYTGQELLVAVGRRLHTDALGLEALGLADPSSPGRPLEVDDTLRVPGHGWLYVVGDANGRALLTHAGKYQARLAADHILGRPLDDGALRLDGRLSPRVIFTEPQVAAVGYTLHGAREAGLNVRAVEQPIGANAGGSFVGHDAPGTARLVVDEDRAVLVGATFTGVEVAEQIHAVTIAIVGEIPLRRLWQAVPCFPTRSEVWLRLLEEYGL